jgi:hypothetical protein
MAGVIPTGALAIVVTAALYLVVLGGSALVRPESARRFLGGFATTRRLHFTELALRVLSGTALVISAPRMAFAAAILFFGWLLVATSVGLALVPWRLHQRFAAWSVPQATQYLPLIGVASVAGGIGLIVAVVLPRAAG